jgi:hypothetical protein
VRAETWLVTARTLTLAWLAAASLVAAWSPQAKAEFNAKDAQVLGRTLGYVGSGMTGIAVVGVVFEPANRTSQHEADLIRAVIGDGLATGRIRLQARLITVEQLAGATGLSALYLTSGLAESTDAIFGAARRLRAPTISADLVCVEAGRCVVGFSSEPTVQILLNRGAAERIGVDFVQAFRMLVREK